jgi:signal transduction histidine kinase
MMNLIFNASHAIRDSGTITIKTGCEGDRVWIEVGGNAKASWKKI